MTDAQLIGTLRTKVHDLEEEAEMRRILFRLLGVRIIEGPREIRITFPGWMGMSFREGVKEALLDDPKIGEVEEMGSRSLLVHLKVTR